MTAILATRECMVEMAMTVALDTMNIVWYLRGLLSADHQVDYFTLWEPTALRIRC